MFYVHRKPVTAMFLLSSILSLSCSLSFSSSAAFASSEQKQIEPSKTENCSDGLLIEKSSGQNARFAKIPVEAHAITVVSESANVVVKRVADISEISLTSNCPRDWCVIGSMVRQAAFSDEIRKGSSLLADDLGSRAIVGGHVYLLPQGGLKGLQLSPQGVMANGEMLPALKGSDMPCNCSGPDYLEISVPQSFSGNLHIGATGKSTISLDSWKGGAVECVMLGNSSLNAGKLEALPKAAFDNKGNGAANIGEVDAKIFVANISGQGNGSIRVKSGKAEMSNATVEGNGTIELHGNFKQMKQLVNGTGKIEVKP